MEPMFSSDFAAFVGAYEIDSKPTGLMEQGQKWIEETFGNSAAKAVIAMSALLTAGAITI